MLAVRNKERSSRFACPAKALRAAMLTCGRVSRLAERAVHERKQVNESTKSAVNGGQQCKTSSHDDTARVRCNCHGAHIKTRCFAHVIASLNHTDIQKQTFAKDKFLGFV